ncbi:hypothetical protein ACFQL4_08855 [Halosimplex aquaticum]
MKCRSDGGPDRARPTSVTSWSSWAGVSVSPGVSVSVSVGVSVGVSVSVDHGVGVGASVGVGLGVSVAVGVGEGVPVGVPSLPISPVHPPSIAAIPVPLHVRTRRRLASSSAMADVTAGE